MKTVFVGLSGGVDSSVSALLLLQQGYRVEGVFMKNWSQESEQCSLKHDLGDAQQVAESLKICSFFRARSLLFRCLSEWPNS